MYAAMPAGQTLTQPEPDLWVCLPDQCPREQELLHTDISFGLNSQGWRSLCLPSRLSRGLGALVLLVLVALAGTLLLDRVQGTSALPHWPGVLPAGQWRWRCPVPCPAQEPLGIPCLEENPSLELGCAGGARDNSSLQKRDVTSPDLLPSPSEETIFHHKLREEAKPEQGLHQIQEIGSRQI